MSINILSIPMIDGGLSHQIPMFVLNQTQLQRIEGIKNHFLLPKTSHSSFKKNGTIILNQDYFINVNNPEESIVEQIRNMMELELKVFETIKPDVIIEDCSFTTPLLAEKNNVPRISIQRTGFFRTIDESKRNKNHKHSLESKADVFFLNDGHKASHKKKLNDQELLSNYLNADTKIIPGIPLIEKLPDNISNKESFFYSGPLLLEDNLSDKSFIEDIQKFIKKNKTRKKVFITTGLVSKQSVLKFIEVLLEKNYAVFTTISIDKAETYKNQLFVHGFYPLNYICSIVDLVIHQCGSGIYHYPLLNKKPAITFGTQCYDREDVALRLEELKLSKHVPSSKDNKNYLDIFKSHLNDFENGNLSDDSQLNIVFNEIVKTIQNFNPIEVLEYSLNQVN